MLLTLIIIALLSYLAGSFPTSIVAGKLLKKIDIREHGSGNAGGTNVLRILGWKAGITVMAIDIAKGVFATYYISRFGDPAIGLSMEMFQIWAGIWAVVGHVWTVFAGFRGGKGVGTAAGMLIVLYPVAFLICLAWFLIIAFSTRYVSLASVTAAILLPVYLFVAHQFWDIRTSDVLLYFAVLMAIFIVFTHRSNIQRLFRGEENRFGTKQNSVRQEA